MKRCLLPREIGNGEYLMIKVIAYYLPQFHNIPENDEWWGDGFTEWTNVRKANPLFEGHRQPRIPLNQNYYNLLSDETKIWQAQIARQNGIYGFCYYHYWFDGRLLLEKPMEQMLKNKCIDIPFCICWANEPWTKSWVNETKVLIPQRYGSREEWRRHFDYLLPFFKDERYIRDNNKPLLMIYRPNVIPNLSEMLECWNSLAKKEGFDGLCFAAQKLELDSEAQSDAFQYEIERQPPLGMEYSARLSGGNYGGKRVVAAALRGLSEIAEKRLGIDVQSIILGYVRKLSKGPKKLDYDRIWDAILSMKPTSSRAVAGAYVDWDNTPRKQRNGEVAVGASPEKFKKHFSQLVNKVRDEYGNDYIFINAWNEWAEGAYLEPDTDFGMAYLKAIKESIENLETN